MNFFRRKDITDYSDEQLIKEIEHANEAAFNLLYKRYSDKLFRYFFRLLSNDVDKAHDFLQDLFIKVLNNAASFNEAQKASTWLYSIATNMCKNEWRNTENRKRLMVGFEAWEHSSNKTIFEKIEAKELNSILDKLLSQLEENDQLILQLRFQQELSIREIASIINIPEGTVKSKIFYLLKKVAKQFPKSTMML